MPSETNGPLRFPGRGKRGDMTRWLQNRKPKNRSMSQDLVFTDDSREPIAGLRPVPGRLRGCGDRNNRREPHSRAGWPQGFFVAQPFLHEAVSRTPRRPSRICETSCFKNAMFPPKCRGTGSQPAFIATRAFSWRGSETEDPARRRGCRVNPHDLSGSTEICGGLLLCRAPSPQICDCARQHDTGEH